MRPTGNQAGSCNVVTPDRRKDDELPVSRPQDLAQAANGEDPAGGCRGTLTCFKVPLRSLAGEAAARLPSEVNACVTGPAGAPLLVVLGGISGTAAVAYRPDGTPGWWHCIFRDGGPVDAGRYRIMGIDFAADESGGFAPDTYEQSAIIADALAALGEEEAFAIIGASYGGMVALAYAERFKPRSTRLAIISAGACPHPMATAARSLQRQVVALGMRQGVGGEALAIARGMGMLTYRTAREFGERFEGGIESCEPVSASAPRRYLDARGRAFAEVTAPGRFLSLSASIDRHRVDPRAIRAPALVIGVEEDQVVPPAQMEALAGTLGGETQLHIIKSLYGHDAFLKEPEIIGGLIASWLETGA
ncbi:alpha/beta fold hydrolase [Sphingosinicella rhizophila]|uniref:Alpha/beta fold hydrolase n=1 Tax=Sphingosinicella rhizophila TaxID=3050082 RepID=A0ABU3Q219_9SPHN|nr:alpha/beta fold hydrolase [Sphingosinicella sp. GR2756]MDT9597357.1 alpha/beta fold hydrolase [Sphingosinicella sp. GR2756]